MLDELRVRNAGIIADAVMEPEPGLVVVTGETGAGKTLLVGALRLLLGETARRDQVGPSGDELVVEGRFTVEGGEHVVRRRVTDGGRSRAYLDGEMVPARTLSDTVAPLVELVAQHDALRLSRSEGVRPLVDAALDAEGQGLAADYRTAFDELQVVREKRRVLGGDHRAIERELDMVRFQADEIAAAGFVAGEDAELRRTAERLRNAEAIGEQLARLQRSLGGESGAAAAMGEATAASQYLAALDAEHTALAAQLREAALLVEELSSETARAAVSFERDPAALDGVEARLAELADLQRKYGDTLDDVLRFGASATARAAELTALLDEAATLDAVFDKTTRRVDEAAARLQAARRTAARRLCEEAVTLLRELGFSEPAVAIDVTRVEPGPLGADRFEIRFASDTSLQPAPVARIASGGELSRLVLALRVAAGVGAAPVVAFDEIDAGIGGTTALAMGRTLQRLAAGRQVLAVTHLPQVAAFAACHFVVRREGTEARLERVEDEARLEELSRMLAGLSASEKGKEHAAELLALGQK